MRHDVSLLTMDDLRLFREGTHCRIQDKLGGHLFAADAVQGAVFAVWAPAAASVSVIGDFNGWDASAHPLRNRNDGSGVWEIFVEGVGEGALYKFRVSDLAGYVADRPDPFARAYEPAPGRASILREPRRDWGDAVWQAQRTAPPLDQPLSIYEVHLGSWRRVPEDSGRVLSYAEAAERLADYVQEMGFTHVELLPLAEQLSDDGPGYDVMGWFAPASLFGPPEEFMGFVDLLHQRGVGVIMDWTASTIVDDLRGLSRFDGGPCFERQGASVFNYAKGEVRSFLLSSALFWLERLRLDGLRLADADSMLFLDQGLDQAGAWTPNMHGGRENLEAVAFLRQLSETIERERPNSLLITECSSALSVTAPVIRFGLRSEQGMGIGDLGGLGFSLAWDVGWKNEMLAYMNLDPIFRKGRQDMLAAALEPSCAERYVLPLSHDEVAPGRGSLFSRMSGDDWRKFASLRLLYGAMWACPGRKLLFMGQEFGQSEEWRPDRSLDWHELARDPLRQGLKRLVEDLNRLYKAEAALRDPDCRAEGFEWVDFRDAESSVISFLRHSRGETILAVFNFTPVPRPNYRIGVPRAGFWRETLNTDARLYGGAGWGNTGGAHASPAPMHGRFDSLSLILPPLGALYFKHEG